MVEGREVREVEEEEKEEEKMGSVWISSMKIRPLTVSVSLAPSI